MNLLVNPDGSALFTSWWHSIVGNCCIGSVKEFPGFFPLMVDYREPFAAAGKIPGGFLSAKVNLLDKEVLTSRIIDRAIRPLFPKDYFNQVQITVTVCSVDKEHTPQNISVLAASLALSVSKIPF